MAPRPPPMNSHLILLFKVQRLNFLCWVFCNFWNMRWSKVSLSYLKIAQPLKIHEAFLWNFMVYGIEEFIGYTFFSDQIALLQINWSAWEVNRFHGFNFQCVVDCHLHIYSWKKRANVFYGKYLLVVFIKS